QTLSTYDQLQFYNPQSSGGACTSIIPAYVENWGMTFDLTCNFGGVAFSYDAGTGMWGLGYGQGNVNVGIPFGPYRGGTASVVLPRGVLMGGAITQSPIYERSIKYDYQGPVNYHTSGMTATHPFTSGVNQKLIVSACDYPATTNGQGVIDTALSGNPVIGFTVLNGYGQCVPTPVLVLTANSTQASAANMDVLTIGGTTINAADYFSTGNNAFPVS